MSYTQITNHEGKIINYADIDQYPSTASASPGGIITAKATSYSDADGNWNASVTLPSAIGRKGDIFTYTHRATQATTINATNLLPASSIVTDLNKNRNIKFQSDGANWLRIDNKVGQYSNSTDQIVSTTALQLLVNTTDLDMTGLNLAGNVFTCTESDTYTFIYQPQITQIAAGIATLWVKKNGLAVANNVANSAIRHGGLPINSTTVPVLTIALDLVVNDTITFWARSSAINSFSIDATAADAIAPMTPSSIVTATRN